MDREIIISAIKNIMENIAEHELSNVNCPFLFGEVELPECLKEEMDK